MNKRITIVGQFRNTAQLRKDLDGLNLDEAESNKRLKKALECSFGATSNCDRALNAKDWFEWLSPELLCNNESNVAAGGRTFAAYHLVAPLGSKPDMKSVPLGFEHPLLSGSRAQSGGDKLQSYQTYGGTLFKKLIKQLDVLASYYTTAWTNELLEYAGDFLWNSITNKAQVDSVTWNDVLFSNYEVYSSIIRYLTCYSEDEPVVLSQFEEILRDATRGLPGWSIDVDLPLTVEALSTCKKSFQEGYVFPKGYNPAMTEENASDEERQKAKSRKKQADAFMERYQIYIENTKGIHQLLRNDLEHAYLFCWLLSKYKKHRGSNAQELSAAVSEMLRVGFTEQENRITGMTPHDWQEVVDEIFQVNLQSVFENEDTFLLHLKNALKKTKSSTGDKEEDDAASIESFLDEDSKLKELFQKAKDLFSMESNNPDKRKLASTFSMTLKDKIVSTLRVTGRFSREHLIGYYSDLFEALALRCEGPLSETLEQLQSQLKEVDRQGFVDLNNDEEKTLEEKKQYVADLTTEKLIYLLADMAYKDDKINDTIKEINKAISFRLRTLVDAKHSIYQISQNSNEADSLAGLGGLLIDVDDIPDKKEERRLSRRNKLKSKLSTQTESEAAQAAVAQLVTAALPEQLKELRDKRTGDFPSKWVLQSDTHQDIPVSVCEDKIEAQLPKEAQQKLLADETLKFVPQKDDFLVEDDDIQLVAESTKTILDDLSSAEGPRTLQADEINWDDLQKFAEIQKQFHTKYEAKSDDESDVLESLRALVLSEMMLATPSKQINLGKEDLSNILGLLLEMVRHLGKHEAGLRDLYGNGPSAGLESALKKINISKFFPVSLANGLQELSGIQKFFEKLCDQLESPGVSQTDPTNQHSVKTYLNTLRELKAFFACVENETSLEVHFINQPLDEYINENEDQSELFLCDPKQHSVFLYITSQNDVAAGLGALQEEVGSDVVTAYQKRWAGDDLSILAAIGESIANNASPLPLSLPILASEQPIDANWCHHISPSHNFRLPGEFGDLPFNTTSSQGLPLSLRYLMLCSSLLLNGDVFGQLGAIRKKDPMFRSVGLANPERNSSFKTYLQNLWDKEKTLKDILLGWEIFNLTLQHLGGEHLKIGTNNLSAFYDQVLYLNGGLQDPFKCITKPTEANAKPGPYQILYESDGQWKPAGGGAIPLAKKIALVKPKQVKPKEEDKLGSYPFEASYNLL